MTKFRNRFFKFLTGCDLIEYQDIMNKWYETLQNAKDIQQTNERLLKHSDECIDLAKRQNEHCARVLRHLEEVNANETVD